MMQHPIIDPPPLIISKQDFDRITEVTLILGKALADNGCAKDASITAMLMMIHTEYSKHSDDSFLERLADALQILTGNIQVEGSVH